MAAGNFNQVMFVAFGSSPLERPFFFRPARRWPDHAAWANWRQVPKARLLKSGRLCELDTAQADQNQDPFLKQWFLEAEAEGVSTESMHLLATADCAGSTRHAEPRCAQFL